VEQGAVTQADLERYMRIQIEESVYFLFTWTQGTFNFEADVHPERQDFLVTINHTILNLACPEHRAEVLLSKRQMKMKKRKSLSV